MTRAPDHARIVVRSARREDLPALRTLLVETWHDTYDPLFGPAKVTAITDEWHAIPALERGLTRQGHVFLAAEIKSAIVGTASATDRGEGLVWLDRLYVSPPAQRSGVGRALLTAVEGAFPQAVEMRLEVERGNGKGLTFYARAGFVPAGDETTCSGVGQAVVLRRQLAGSEGGVTIPAT